MCYKRNVTNDYMYKACYMVYLKKNETNKKSNK